ncbi:hypothetical protein AVEN_128787-1 [Araneus ventricosus]|uniref:Uncharacterized protein n=1 Tax=Araneus ventricosus TaxID=182803 RepID=A0A4Y2VLE9_ARAVE|nr:hypothetical protein AVEN_128787-1 [Araneus ventricosus]
MSSLNSSSYSLQAPALAVLQQQSHKIQIDPTHTSFVSNNSSRLFNSQNCKYPASPMYHYRGLQPLRGPWAPKFTRLLLMSSIVIFGLQDKFSHQAELIRYLIE